MMKARFLIGLLAVGMSVATTGCTNFGHNGDGPPTPPTAQRPLHNGDGPPTPPPPPVPQPGTN